MSAPQFKAPARKQPSASNGANALEEFLSGPAANQAVSEEVVEIDPATSVMNRLHRRKTEVGELAALADSIHATGQLLPALGWRVEDEADQATYPGARYVLIYGARRREACSRSGSLLKLRLIPRPTETEIVRMMFSENRGRQDYSPLEMGLEFEAYLNAGGRKTAEELASALGEDLTKIKRCLQVARLPTEILSLYADPHWLPLTLGVEMAQIVAEDKEPAKRMLAKAGVIAERDSLGDPTRELLAAAKPPSKPHALAGKARYNGVEVGQYRGGMGPKDELRIVIGRKAPVELKAKLMELLGAL